MRHKICPICGTAAHERALECDVCGASLQNVEVVDRYPDTRQSRPGAYDFRHGETDLVEGSLRWRGGSYILGGIIALAVAACGGLVIFSASRFLNMVNPPPTVTPVITVENEVISVTDTPSPTLFLPTVTADAPPTRTITPSPAPTETPGPCMQEVMAGDSLIALISRCGHRDLDVIPEVLEMNNLSAPEVIQVGQTLSIPWPTPTVDPNSLPTATTEGEGEAVAAVSFVTDSAGEIVYIPPTAMLQPGVAWHRVVKDENIIVIAVEYGANIKILSELNPEVSFSQCDFGEFTGGPSCVVTLYEGQQIRVPAPTPTPTLSPTPSGSETPTPSPTPTFNAPSAMSPGDRALFRRGELVTLRWVASGTLTEGQVYRVKVQDITTKTDYVADTTELFFIVPEAWQGRDSRRHEYAWTVSVIDSDNPDNPYFSTAPRVFVWEGLAEEDADAEE